jgi:hypothetical protein
MRSIKKLSEFNGLVETNKWYKISKNGSIWLIQVYDYDISIKELSHKGDCYIINDDDTIVGTYSSWNGVYHGWGYLSDYTKVERINRSELRRIFLKNDIRRTYK